VIGRRARARLIMQGCPPPVLFLDSLAA